MRIQLREFDDRTSAPKLPEPGIALNIIMGLIIAKKEAVIKK